MYLYYYYRYNTTNMTKEIQDNQSNKFIILVEYHQLILNRYLLNYIGHYIMKKDINMRKYIGTNTREISRDITIPGYW